MSEVEKLKAQIVEAYPSSRALSAPPYAAVCDLVDALIKAVRSEDAELCLGLMKQDDFEGGVQCALCAQAIKAKVGEAEA